MSTIKSSIEKLSEEIGFDIGKSDSYTQGRLLNGLCRALNQIKLNNDKSDLEMQLCYIDKELNTNARHVIIALAAFCQDSLNNKL